MNKPDRERRSKFVSTPGQWYPTPKDGKVQVFFSELLPSPGYPRGWRVSVWGGDDFGMERDFTSRMEALDVFNFIEDGVTEEGLRKIGFNNA